jgi:asparagine synthase (glutamine-hydrolysing)
MCGIAGILNITSNKPPQEDLMTRMISILRHRGPEESGIYIDRDVGLGHARLSIIGLDDGTQPLCNEDETLWIVYNGEIFNYIELRQDRKKKGHQFKTETDTEVILHLYEDLGPACLNELNGQFAFAIWDYRKKELFLARDHVGICPLYFTFQSGRFHFASEIKAIFMDPRVPRDLDVQSLSQVLTCWTTIGSRTVFQKIEEVCPGHFMIVKLGEGPGQQKPFWAIPHYPVAQQWQGTREEAVEDIGALLKDAVRLRLRADVPVGAYLSGGLDSSIITSVIARNFNNHLKTFSLGFEEGAFDEAGYQAEMVDFLGTDHHQTTISNREVRDNFPEVVWHCEKPLLRTGPVPLFLLSKLVRENRFKVVLTGEGADEVFGGYNIFKEAKVRWFWGQQPQSRWRPLLVERLYPYIFQNPSRGRAFLQKFFSVSESDMRDPFISHRKRWENTGKSNTFFHHSVLAELAGFDPLADLADRIPADFEKRDIFSRAQWLEMNIFMSNYLLSSQGDRVAMAHSLELRLPFLDHRVIDFAAKLPHHWKMPGLKEKFLLKKAYCGQVPDSIRNRPKQPYRAPIGPAFFQDDPEKVSDLLCLDRLGRMGIFNVKKVMNLFEKYLQQGQAPASETHNMAIVGILSTQMLHEQFVENFPGRDIVPAKPTKIIRKNQD